MDERVGIDLEKIRVLHGPVASAYGGITRYVFEMWKYIDKERFQFDFFTMKPQMDREEELKAQGCRIYHISKYAEDDIDTFRKEVCQMMSEQYDVVHLHTSFWKSFVLEECAKECGIKRIIVHAHNTDVSKTDDLVLYNKQRKEHFEIRSRLDETIATDFLACTVDASKWLFGNQLPKEKIAIALHAIDIPLFSYNLGIREKYRKQYGVEEKFAIGFVGRLTYQKNPDFMLRVFCEVLKRKPNAVLIFVGMGELKVKLEVVIEKEGIKDSVIFLEKRDDIYNVFQMFDMFCLPSRFEGLGRVLIEAQISGLQCIASDNVPKETHLTTNVEYVPLEENKWVEAILEKIDIPRIDQTEVIKKAGYDLKDNAKILEKLYLEGE